MNDLIIVDITIDELSMVVFKDNEVNKSVRAVLMNLSSDIQYVKWMVLLGLIETASIVYPNVSSEWIVGK